MINDMLNKVVCGDCMEVMKGLPDESVDCIITDPPYGVRKEFEWDNAKLFEDSIDNWLAECLRVSRGGVVWFTASKTIPLILRNNAKFFHRILFWDKPNGSQFNGASNNHIWYSAEPILVFVKNESFLKKGLDSKWAYSNISGRTIPSSEFGHPTTKPLKIMKVLVEHYSNVGDIILDPFLGSGTTAVACKLLKRNFIGIELSQEYCEIAINRLKAIPDKGIFEY